MDTIQMDNKVFSAMLEDAERVMQRLLKNMMEKGIDEGSLAIKIDVEFVKEEQDGRVVTKPRFPYKVTSALPIKDEVIGRANNDNFELVFDEESGEYAFRPIAGSVEQQTIFNAGGVVVEEDYPRINRAALGHGEIYAIPQQASDPSDGDLQEDADSE